MVKSMEIREIEAIIEAVLFASGNALSVDRISEIVEVDKNTVRSIIHRMMDYYNYERRGLQIIQLDDCYQLCTRPEYFEYIKKLVQPKQQQGLSKAAMEVLSIIAYNQPITKSSIDYIRGVNSDAALARLLERGLVEEKGRLDAPGKPFLYGTTQEFLRCFGLRSLEDLPILNMNEIPQE